MAKKSGVEVAGDLAHLGKALYDIIKALMQGGWSAAAMQLLKHYWPQILGVALALLLIPVIVFCCLPMALFGYESSTDTEIAAMTAQAGTVSACYDQYEAYIDACVEQIKKTVMKSGTQNTEMNGTTDGAEPEPEIRYEVAVSGEIIQKYWFMALHAVSVGNDLNAVTEADIRSFAGKCVDYTLTQTEENTETGASVIIKRLEIRYLTPTEIMENCGYSDSDENWARLIYKTLAQEYNASVGIFASPFPDTNWRNHITSNFGYRTSPYTGFHGGVDIGMPMGTPICAVKDGTVVEAVYGTGSYGYYVIIDHGNGVQTLYAHCSKLCVSAGDVVTQGTVIAKVGSTGRSTGPHCHLEVRIDGERVDPEPYLP